MTSHLYRLTCSIDSVLVAETAEDAMAFARSQHHHVHVEQLESPEALIGLDPDEAVVVLAALQRVRQLNGQLGADASAVAGLVERLEQAIALIDDQASLRLDAPPTA
jgi:hypothetical protein